MDFFYLEVYYEEKWQNDIGFLKKLPLFQKWQLNEISQFRLNADPINVSYGTFLNKDNEEPGFIYIIKEGEVEITKECSEREERNRINRIAILTKGAVFGYKEMILRENKRSETVIAKNNCLIFKISFHVLLFD